MSRTRVAVLQIVSQQLTVTAAAAEYGISRRHLHRLLARYREGGIDALEPRSRRPKRTPIATPVVVRERVIELRSSLTAAGLDAGPVTIGWQLEQEGHTTAAAAAAARQQFVSHDKAELPNFGFASVDDGTLHTECLPSQDPQTEPGLLHSWAVDGQSRSAGDRAVPCDWLTARSSRRTTGSCNSIRNLGRCSTGFPTTQAETIDGR